MTTPPELDGTGRRRFKYASDDDGPVSLPGNADATPSVIRPGDVVEVNAETADLLDQDSDHFTPTDEDVTVPPMRREQRAAEVVEAAEGLRGAALNDALIERGLPTSGYASADDKRAAVAEHDAAQQTGDGQDGVTA